MTKTRITGLAALALAATALVSPALASAAPTAAGDVVAVEFNVIEHNNIFGFRLIDFDCSDFNDGQYPYVVYDNLEVPYITYFAGDGEPIGHYIGEVGAFGFRDAPFSLIKGLRATVSPHHGTVTFYCANTPQAAFQKA